ncbi:MAG TPA: A24 family peptidase [Candidatus Nanoarchaeia archaeon]|nr:A24 family peptidase [Candidatus Nanoarchaeia archaeon]
MPDWIIAGVALTWLGIASYTDIKTREVPDWLSYSLIAFGFGYRLLASVIYQDISFILAGLLGFVALLSFGALMFYTGQWGGGDSKILMGLGALIGLETTPYSMLLSFFSNILLVGGVYGVVWSIGLAASHFSRFRGEFRKQVSGREFKTTLAVIWILAGAGLGLILVMGMTLLYGAVIGILFVMPFLFAAVKAVELSSMYSYVKPDKLTEGDWIAEDVVVGKKVVAGPKDLGISKDQIKELTLLYSKGRVGRIRVKSGIPFVPSFLIAFLITLAFGNLILSILNL